MYTWKDRLFNTILALAIVFGLIGFVTSYYPRVGSLGPYTNVSVDGPHEPYDTTKPYGLTLPVVSVVDGKEILHVSVYRCNNADHIITIQGVIGWRYLVPGPVLDIPDSIPASGKSFPMVPGCNTETFNFPIDPAVYAKLASLASKGVNRTVWDLQGTADPSEGATRKWNTQEFIVQYNGPT